MSRTKGKKPQSSESAKLERKIEDASEGRRIVALSEKRMKEAFPWASKDAIHEVKRRLEE